MFPVQEVYIAVVTVIAVIGNGVVLSMCVLNNKLLNIGSTVLVFILCCTHFILCVGTFLSSFYSLYHPFFTGCWYVYFFFVFSVPPILYWVLERFFVLLIFCTTRFVAAMSIIKIQYIVSFFLVLIFVFT